MNLEFFLYEIVARVVAVYFFVDGSLALWTGLSERKTSVVNYAFMDMFWRLPDWSADRETAPWAILVSDQRQSVHVVRMARRGDIWVVASKDMKKPKRREFMNTRLPYAAFLE